MIKAIALIRTSTLVQEIESQKEQVLQMCYEDGLKEDEVEVVGQAGASAIKVDAAYQKNMDKVYDLIKNNSSIKCVYAWAIDRIGRRESILHTFREFLVQRKIQLKIKANNLRLLDDEGNEDFGVKLQFSLYATLASAEMQNKQERFKRGKERCKRIGKVTNSKVVFGYKKDDNGFYAIDENESEIVRFIFDEYGNGRTSIRKLVQEIHDRGLRRSDGRLVLEGTVRNVLRESYKFCGRDEDINRPPIITTEIADKVIEKLKKNVYEASRASKHHYFAAKLIRCRECGNYLMSYTASSYKCARKVPVKGILRRKGCDNGCIKINVVDGILWRVAYDCHHDWLESMTKEKKSEMKKQLREYHQKMNECQRRLDMFDERKKRLSKSYIMGLIDDKEVEQMKIDLDKEERQYRDSINDYTNKIKMIENNLSLGMDERYMRELNALNMIFVGETNKEKYDLVHKYILGGTMGKREGGIPGHENWKGTELNVETMFGSRKFVFFGKVRGKCNTYEYYDGEWVEFLYDEIEHSNWTNYGKNPKKKNE